MPQSFDVFPLRRYASPARRVAPHGASHPEAETVEGVNNAVPDESGPREGYLVLADIAGYTEFFTGTELEHAQGILEELTTLIANDLAPPLRFVKLEGDAILCCADGSTFADGERLLEVLEVCYFDFSNRLLDMARSATCPCAACASMDSLDLKFVSHYGTYMVQHVGGVEDVAGPDVILVHRLLKNTITEHTGCRAYVFLTEACLEHLPSSLTLAEHAESYESLGEIKGGVHDLKPVLREMRETRREYVSHDDADFEWTFEATVPQAVLWQYFVDPEKRLRWETNNKAIKNRPNSRGRLGPGAYTHCSRDGCEHRYVDWRPFNYFTEEITPPQSPLIPSPVAQTFEFIPSESGGTVVNYRVRVRRRGLLMRLVGLISGPVVRRIYKGRAERLEELLREDGWLDRDTGSAVVG